MPGRTKHRYIHGFAIGLAILTIGLGLGPWLTPNVPSWGAWLALAGWEGLRWQRSGSVPQSSSAVLLLWAAAGLTLVHEIALITLEVMTARVTF